MLGIAVLVFREVLAPTHAQADEQRHERAEDQRKEDDLRKITGSHVSNSNSEESGKRLALRSRANRLDRASLHDRG